MSEDSKNSIVGRIVGPYRVTGPLGSGGDFPLYGAEHLHLDRRAALRLIGADDAVQGVLDGFLAKARSVSRIKHENVIGLVDLGEAGDGTVYLAMELPEGRSLAQIIAEQGAIASARAKIVARQIGAAFLAAERQTLGCAEVTTDQIFLCRDPSGAEVVRIDFATAEILGVPAPALPEGLAPRGSVYGLGRLLYHMVVGHPPPPLEADEPPPDPTLSRPDLDIPVALDALIVRALDPDPEKRWPDIAALLRAIDDSDRRPSARGMLAVGGDGDVYASGAHRRFGSMRARLPSGRALISGGVAVAVAVSLTIVLVIARPNQPSGEQVESPSVAQAPAAGRRPAEVVPAAAIPPAAAVPASGAVPASVTVAAAVPIPPAPPAQTVSPTEPAAAEIPGRQPPETIGAAPQAAPRAVPAPSPSASATTGDVGAPRSGPTGGGGPGEDADAPQRPREEVAKTVVAGAGGASDDACAVTLGSRPWSEVWIDGRRAGFTPLVDYLVDCGPHDVVFKSSDSHIEKRVAIVVAAGQTFKKTVDLPPPSACVVTLGSRPWSEVWIDGRRAGVTPLVEYQVACGKHEVLFRSSDAKVERREDIVVQNGQPLKKVVALMQE